MVSPAVYIPVEAEYFLGTCFDAQAATFAPFPVNHHCTSDFCHIFCFMNNPISRNLQLAACCLLLAFKSQLPAANREKQYSFI
jgi:hypothetical protein